MLQEKDNQKKNRLVQIKVSEEQFQKMRKLVEKLQYSSISEMIRRKVLVDGIKN